MIADNWFTDKAAKVSNFVQNTFFNRKMDVKVSKEDKLSVAQTVELAKSIDFNLAVCRYCATYLIMVPFSTRFDNYYGSSLSYKFNEITFIVTLILLYGLITIGVLNIRLYKSVVSISETKQSRKERNAHKDHYQYSDNHVYEGRYGY